MSTSKTSAECTASKNLASQHSNNSSIVFTVGMNPCNTHQASGTKRHAKTHYISVYMTLVSNTSTNTTTITPSIPSKTTTVSLLIWKENSTIASNSNLSMTKDMLTFPWKITSSTPYRKFTTIHTKTRNTHLNFGMTPSTDTKSPRNQYQHHQKLR